MRTLISSVDAHMHTYVNLKHLHRRIERRYNYTTAAVMRL